MSTKLPSPRLRLALLTPGVLVFTGTAIWIATSPISVSVEAPASPGRPGPLRR